MDAQDFLSSARQLVRDGATEVDYRNSISRAYYTAFHCCKEMALQHSLVRSRCGHEELHDACIGSDDRDLQVLGQKLRQAKKLRHEADYRLNKRMTSTDASQQLTKVDRIIGLIDDLEKKKSA